MNPYELQKMGASILIDHLIQTATEKGILIASDAPDGEMRVVQQKLDMLSLELARRTSW